MILKNQDSIVSALDRKATDLSFNTALVTFLSLVVVLVTFQYQNRSQIIREKLKIDSSLIENAILLGDQFFLTQYFSSFMASPTIDFGAIQDLSNDDWVFYPSKTRMETKRIPLRLSFSLYSFKVRQSSTIGNGQEKWRLIYVLNFGYSSIVIAFLLSLLISLGVRLYIRSALRKTGQYLVTPIANLASELDQVKVDEKGFQPISIDKSEYGFTETDLLLEKFNLMLERITGQQDEIRKGEIFKALNKLSQQVAHDIKSPLGALKTATENIDKNPKASATLITKAVERIRGIFEDLEIQSEDDLTQVSELQNTELVSFISSIIKEKELEYSKDILNIEFTFKQKSIHRSIDRIAIGRAFSNLINNSIEATSPEKAIVSITIEQDQNSKIAIRINDNGPGIPEKLLPKVFDHGFTSNKKNGSGVGLSQAGDAIAKHGGSLKLSNENQGGLLVEIEL